MLNRHYLAALCLSLLSSSCALSHTRPEPRPTEDASLEDSAIDDAAVDDAALEDASPGDAGPVCEAERVECDGECVETDEDPAHCGRCDRRCAEDETCRDGSCSTCDEGTIPCRGGCCVWSVETVDAEASFYVSLRVDARGSPHIAYSHAEVGAALRYASWDGSAWQRRTLAEGTGAAQLSLELDASGAPHIASVGFADSTLPIHPLLYGHLEDDAWVAETVAEDADHPVVELDAFGSPYIAFRSGPVGRAIIRLARRAGPAWQLETVDTGDLSIPALALDGERVHVAYRSRGERSLRYARGETGPWEVTTVAESMAHVVPALAITSAGQLRLAFASVSDDDAHEAMQYARSNGAEWLVETVETHEVDRLAGPFRTVELALDDFDRAHVTFRGEVRRLRYAHWNGVAWRVEDVPVESVSTEASIDVDARGRPHIAFHPHFTGPLMYATLVDASP